jgi:hypothetical protein
MSPLASLRPDEARRDFTQARETLASARKDHPRDLGVDWRAFYIAEAARTKCEAVFKAKCIPLP